MMATEVLKTTLLLIQTTKVQTVRKTILVLLAHRARVNKDKVKDLVSPGVMWCIERGMTMKIVPYKKIEWNPAFKEATEKYSGQVKLSADGRTAILHLADLAPCMQMSLKYNVRSADGTELSGRITNTIHALPAK